MLDSLPNKSFRNFLRKNVKYAKRPRRYKRLLLAAERLQPKSIVEIGVFTGKRATEMIDAASLRSSAADISYFGFDLFDIMDDDILKQELSKRPDPMGEIKGRLDASGAKIELIKGWTNETLPDFFAKKPAFKADLMFIDGGHAVETIQNDWDNTHPHLTPGGSILLDDYYVDCPHLTDEFGCNTLIENLDASLWDVEIHPEVDRFVHDNKPHNVAIVEVRRRSS